MKTNNNNQLIPNKLNDLVKVFEENGFPVRSAHNEHDSWWILFDDDANDIEVQNKFVGMIQFMNMYLWNFLTEESLMLKNVKGPMVTSNIVLFFYNWIRPLSERNCKIEQNYMFKCRNKCLTIDQMTVFTELFFEWYNGLSEEDKNKLYNEMDHSHDQTISEK